MRTYASSACVSRPAKSTWHKAIASESSKVLIVVLLNLQLLKHSACLHSRILNFAVARAVFMARTAESVIMLQDRSVTAFPLPSQILTAFGDDSVDGCSLTWSWSHISYRLFSPHLPNLPAPASSNMPPPDWLLLFPPSVHWAKGKCGGIEIKRQAEESASVATEAHDIPQWRSVLVAALCNCRKIKASAHISKPYSTVPPANLRFWNLLFHGFKTI